MSHVITRMLNEQVMEVRLNRPDLTTQSGPGDIPGTEGMSGLGFTYKYQERIAEAALAMHECDKPVIAAINGAAVGGGLAFALACGMRSMWKTAPRCSAPLPVALKRR